MDQQSLDNYLSLRSQTDGGEDLIGRLLFSILGTVGRNREAMTVLLGDLVARLESGRMESMRASDMNAESVRVLLEELIQAVDSKAVDLSGVTDAIETANETIRSGNDRIASVLETVADKDDDEVVALLEIIAEAIGKIDVRPSVKVDTSAVAEVVRGISSRIEEVSRCIKEKKYPERMEVSGEVSIQKPKWWQEWSFSWEPLGKILQTALSPVIAAIREISPKSPDIPTRHGRVLVEVDRVGGGGGGVANLGTVEDRLVEWVYNGKIEDATYVYYCFDSSIGWKIKRKTKNDGSWKIARGKGSYADAVASLTQHQYLSH